MAIALAPYVLVLHDRQLAWLLAFRYTGAWVRIDAFTGSAALSPLPPA